MNLFAVNAAEINGSIEVWSWYGTSDIALQASGELKIGEVLSGSSSIALNSDAQAYAELYPTGQPADIVLQSTGQAIYGRSGSGLSSIQIESQGDGTRRVFGESASSIVFEADGDAQVVAPAAASFTIVLSTAIDERVTPAVTGESISLIKLDSTLDNESGRAIYLEPMEAMLELATVSTGHLIIDSPPGDSAIPFETEGDGRLGGRVYLEAFDACIELYTRGQISSIRYVYGDGSSDIEISSKAEKAGKPTPVAGYVEAPRSRLLVVPAESRIFVVPRDRTVVVSGGYMPIEAAIGDLFYYANTQLPSDMVIPDVID